MFNNDKMYNLEHNIDIELLRAKVNGLSISSDTDNIAATRLLAEIHAALKNVERTRDEKIEEVMAEHAPDIHDLRELKKLVKSKMDEYRLLAQAKIAEIKAGIAAGTMAGGTEPGNTYLDAQGRIVGLVPDSIRTESGTYSRRRLKQVKVVDFSAVPDEYKKPDMKAIRAALAKGILEIPGIKATESETTQIRTP